MSKKIVNVVSMPSRTYRAKLFTSPWQGSNFKIAGTLDGFIDLAVPGGGTYPLSIDEARSLMSALNSSIADVQANCMHERDSLLMKERKL